MQWNDTVTNPPPVGKKVLVWAKRYHEDTEMFSGRFNDEGKFQSYIGQVGPAGTLWAEYPEHPNKPAVPEVCPACGARYDPDMGDSGGDPCCSMQTIDAYRDCTERPENYAQTWAETPWGARKAGRAAAPA